MSSSNSESSSSFEENYGVHPLSYVIKEELSFKSSWVIAGVLLDIRTTDQDIIAQFGPADVDFGGTFGGSFIPQDIRRVVDELRVKKSFKHEDLQQAAAEARLWQNAITERVSDAIWAARQKSLLVGAGSETAVPV